MSPIDRPTHRQVLGDLRLLRERGLWRLRYLRLPALAAAAAAVDGREDADVPAAQERLLRRAVERLGDEEPGLAAQYLFGLVQGTAGRRPVDLRSRAAQELGLSAETFRKEPERLLVSRVADEVILLCEETEQPQAGDPLVPRPGSGDHPTAPDDVRDMLATTETDGGHGSGDFGPFPVRCGRFEVPWFVRWGPVEHLRDVDVVVSSENVYLEPARAYTSTLSGALRRGAAWRNAAGAVTRDVVAEELAQWVTKHGSPGLPFEAGLVVPTSSGRLEEQGIRRLYHAAVAVPQIGTNEYGVAQESVVRGVHSLVQLLREEREQFTPPLRSFSVPLFGAGYGGLDPRVSFTRLWSALRAELAADGDWQVHVTVLHRAEAEAVLRTLHPGVDSPG